MKWLTATLCLVAILACTTNAMAGRCSGISPNIFCDDFDRWCVDPPADPEEACDVGSTEDEAAFWAYWPRRGGACEGVATKYRLWTEGDAVYYKYATVKSPQSPDTQRMPRHFHDMTTEIEANPLNTEGYSGINGSGEILSSTDPSYVDPDTIGTVLKGHTYIWNNTPCGSYSNFTYYTELTLDGDRAPTNFIWRNCYAETGDHGDSPHQLLQSTASDINPDPSTTWHHASFAFGLVAHYDDDANPCDVDTGRKPTAWHAFVYDGKDWTRLKYPAFDIPSDHASFRPWKSWNRLMYWIGTDHIEVRLYNARARGIWDNPQGKCGHQLCETGKCFGGIDNGTGGLGGNDCAGNDDNCRPLQGVCDVGGTDQCIGGANDGDPCDEACPGGLCTEENVCDGGDNHGLHCDCAAAPPPLTQYDPSLGAYFVARVPRVYKGAFNRISMGAGRGVDQMTPLCEEIRPGPPVQPTRCVGGINHGDTCASADDCPPSVGTCVSGVCDGGTRDGEVCIHTCPDGVCNTQGYCDGGTNAGQECECPSQEECLKPVSNGANDMGVDEVILWDGVFTPAPGACCRADTGTCEDEVLQPACTGHDVWHGAQICDDILCCPKPWADIDLDDDVDQTDFGLWQICYTDVGGGVNPGCECYDRDDSTGAQGGDGDDVDPTDFGWFEHCFTGPTVPLDLNDPPEDCIP